MNTACRWQGRAPCPHINLLVTLLTITRQIKKTFPSDSDNHSLLAKRNFKRQAQCRRTQLGSSPVAAPTAASSYTGQSHRAAPASASSSARTGKAHVATLAFLCGSWEAKLGFSCLKWLKLELCEGRRVDFHPRLGAAPAPGWLRHLGRLEGLLGQGTIASAVIRSEVKSPV